ncbi:MAG TPA: hypothetical protein VE525_02105 [Rubrobacter sp.]|nr:hypothetical protein [Rubrobacter sp.]
MDGKRARSLMRGVAALALAMSLAVAGACGPSTKEEKASAAKDKSPGRSAKSVSSATSGASNRGDLPQGREPVQLDPADFSVSIDNPYWPMSPGTKWVYSETDTKGTNQKVVVEVTDQTKMIANGIEARVVRDTVTENGAPVEITDDCYAQDKAGNIWYLGEHVTNYKNGKVVGHGGSFEAGVDGAQPGIAMPADPDPGLSYRQEYYKGEAEDKAAVITIGEEQVQVPLGYFDKGVLMTRDLVPTEPKVQELKFYAPNVGPLLSVHTDGDGSRAELMSYSRNG